VTLSQIAHNEPGLGAVAASHILSNEPKRRQKYTIFQTTVRRHCAKHPVGRCRNILLFRLLCVFICVGFGSSFAFFLVRGFVCRQKMQMCCQMRRKLLSSDKEKKLKKSLFQATFYYFCRLKKNIPFLTDN
jgi:hypothetical protein